MDSEEKYSEIRNKLKNLQHVKAGDDFVNRLHMKIVEVEAEKRHVHETRFDEPRGGFLKNLFGSMQYPWLAPAVGFTVLIFFVFYVTYLNRTTEKDQQVLSTQNQENTGQKNTDANKNPAAQQEPYNTSEPDKTSKDNGNQPGKDIASDMKTERSSIEPLPTENNGRLTDRDEPKNYKEETKTFESSRKNELKNETQPPESESKSPDIFLDKNNTDETNKQNESSESMDKSGILSLKKSKTENKPPGDSERTARGKVEENEADNKKLREKINKISRSSLEKIRDEVLK